MARSKISKIAWHALVTSDRKDSELPFADQSCGADMQGRVAPGRSLAADPWQRPARRHRKVADAQARHKGCLADAHGCRRRAAGRDLGDLGPPAPTPIRCRRASCATWSMPDGAATGCTGSRASTSPLCGGIDRSGPPARTKDGCEPTLKTQSPGILARQRQTTLDICDIGMASLRQAQCFDFGARDLAAAFATSVSGWGCPGYGTCSADPDAAGPA